MKFKFEANRTYATEANADAAVAKRGFAKLRHFMMRDDNGRWFPVFVGMDVVQYGVHFHFNVVA